MNIYNQIMLLILYCTYGCERLRKYNVHRVSKQSSKISTLNSLNFLLATQEDENSLPQTIST